MIRDINWQIADLKDQMALLPLKVTEASNLVVQIVDYVHGDISPAQTVSPQRMKINEILEHQDNFYVIQKETWIVIEIRGQIQTDKSKRITLDKINFDINILRTQNW